LKFRYGSAWIKKKCKNLSTKKKDVIKDGEETQKKNSKVNSHNEEGFPENYVKSPVQIPGRKENYYPNDVQVAIFDCTSKLKNYPEFVVKNGLDYIHKYVLYEAVTFLGMDTGTEAFFLCFDRGSPANKDSEHANRYRDLKFHNIMDISDDKIFIDDETIISQNNDEWKLFANDKILKQELIHYITKRIVDFPDESNDDNQCLMIDDELYTHPKKKKYVYTPPENKMLFLFGGMRDTPNPKRRERLTKRPDHELYYVGNEKVTTNELEEEDIYYLNSKSTYKRISGIYSPRDNSYKQEEQQELLEGELSCLYFAKPYIYSGKNILFISVDGDMLLQLLLLSKDRLNENGTFKNKVYLRLLLHGTYEDIDINSLFILMCEDPLFKNNGISDPPVYYTFASCLIQNDYFKNPCFGIKNVKISGIECNYILYSILSMLGDYKNLIEITPIKRNNFEQVSISINEAQFIKFIQSVYVIKYKNLALKKMEKNTPKSKRMELKNSLSLLDEFEMIMPSGVTKNFVPHQITQKHITMVRQYLMDLPKINNRMISDEKMRVFCRMTEWIFLNYYNSWRGNCKIPSPLSTLDRESYYGWTISIVDNKCVTAERVSTSRIPNGQEFFNTQTIFNMSIENNNGILTGVSISSNIDGDSKITHIDPLYQKNESLEMPAEDKKVFSFLPKKIITKHTTLSNKVDKTKSLKHVSNIQINFNNST
jgi:hypothetical protein